MPDINPNWSAVFDFFLTDVVRIVRSIGEVCGEFWFVFTTYKVEDVLEFIIPDNTAGEIIDWLVNLVLADYFLELWLWQFFLFSGILVAVIMNVVKAVK